MSDDLILLVFTAASVGFFHTLVGPDHYLPFIALARARKWSLGRTVRITLLCGLGHVSSSVLLGAIGIALGSSVTRLEMVEGRRGDMAAWLLIAVGLIYLAWGLRRATRLPGVNRPRDPSRFPLGSALLTPWSLFVIFVLGPCEPLIPVLMVPAATSSFAAVALVAAAFAAATLATMSGLVVVGRYGVSRVPLGGFERYGHAMAGATILLCGVGIRFLGL